ncbi:unnamed protein product, partial [Strongylus vulgaris]
MEPPAEPPMEPPTEPPMEPPTEPPMEPLTEPPMEPPIEAPTETLPAESPAETSSQVPVKTTLPSLPPTSTMKYVLNQEAAEKYWATAKFETTAAPLPPQPLTEVETPQDEPKEATLEKKPMEEVRPEKPVEEVTWKYIHNEDAAQKYWATAKFETTTAVPLPAPEPLTKAPASATNEVAQEEPVAEVTLEEKPAEKTPVAVETPSTYILNEEAAEKYWSTAKIESTTAVPSPVLEPQASEAVTDMSETESSPVEEKSDKEFTSYVLNEKAAEAYW